MPRVAARSPPPPGRRCGRCRAPPRSPPGRAPDRRRAARWRFWPRRRCPRRSAGHPEAVSRDQPWSPLGLVRVLHHADEHRREQRKDIGLQERHQQLQEHHERHEQHRARRHQPAAKDENQAEQREDHEMPRRHVREQPQRERERLHDLPDDLDGGHDERHRHGSDPRHARRHEHDRLQIALRAERPKSRDFHRKEGGQRQRARHGEVARGGGAPRQKPQQIAVQNEEEEGEDVGRELGAVVADVGDGDVVADEQHDRLDRRAEPRRGLPLAVAPRHLAAAVPDRQEHQRGGDAHEDDVLGGRDVDAEDHPVGRQVRLEPERPLDRVAVRGVLEDGLADIGTLDHFRNSVSTKSSGKSTPRKPSDAGSGARAARSVTANTSSTPSASARTPIPPSQRAMNTGWGAPIAGRSSATAASCAATATAPPIAPSRPPPSQRAEGEDRDREAEPQGDVRIAFAEAPAETILLVVWHDADGNIPAWEKFRKKSYNHANLCGAWEYDVVTLEIHVTPNPAPIPRPSSPPLGDVELLERLARARADLLAQVGRRIVGQTEVLDGILTAVFSGGHALLLGVPGLAKTLMVQTVAQTLDLKFSRIQFTPDLMPTDITGTEIIEEDQATGKRAFRFVRGPVFANIVLADEVNRTPPKTQAALLQAT